jgi:putative PIN family toxin of toxin-antitoxin system
MSGPVPVVLDTNVVLSALVFGGGKAGQLRRAWQQGAFIPLVSTATAEELIRVLAYPKFRLSREDQSELLADYLPYAQTVRMPQPPPAVPSCRDPLDLPFMELAVAGQAKMLFSGDRDLLVLSAEFERMAACTIVPLDGLIELLA